MVAESVAPGNLSVCSWLFWGLTWTWMKGARGYREPFEAAQTRPGNRVRAAACRTDLCLPAVRAAR